MQILDDNKDLGNKNKIKDLKNITDVLVPGGSLYFDYVNDKSYY